MKHEAVGVNGGLRGKSSASGCQNTVSHSSSLLSQTSRMPAWCFAVCPRSQLKPSFRGTEGGKSRPTGFQPRLSRARGAEVIWKPFLLVLSPSSHFNLSVQPHTSLLPAPRSPGKPEFSDQGPCTPGHHGTQAQPRSAPLARENLHGISNKYPYIIHGTWLLSWAPH